MALGLISAQREGMLAQVSHQAQGGRKHDQERQRAQQADEGGRVESRVNPGGKIYLKRVAGILCHAVIGAIGGIQMGDDESQAQEGTEQNTGADEGEDEGSTGKRGDVSLHHPQTLRGEADHFDTVEHVEPGNGPEADTAAAQPEEESDTEERIDLAAPCDRGVGGYQQHEQETGEAQQHITG